MAKIDRHTGNLIPFGRIATSADRKVFGGTIESDTLDDNLTPELQEGWQATTTPTLFPKLRDFNAAMFTAQQLIAYVIQRGIPEYHAQQEYFIDSMCVSGGTIYISLTDNNTNNLLADPVHWLDLLEIPDNSIELIKMAANSINTQQVIDNAITLAKMAHGNDNKLLGFSASGVPVEVDNVAFGDSGQTLQVVTRFPNTTYYNLTDKTIQLIIDCGDLFQDTYFMMNGIIIIHINDASGFPYEPNILLMVPPNFSYSFPTSFSFNTWREIR